MHFSRNWWASPPVLFLSPAPGFSPSSGNRQDDRAVISRRKRPVSVFSLYSQYRVPNFRSLRRYISAAHIPGKDICPAAWLHRSRPVQPGAGHGCRIARRSERAGRTVSRHRRGGIHPPDAPAVPPGGTGTARAGTKALLTLRQRQNPGPGPSPAAGRLSKRNRKGLPLTALETGFQRRGETHLRFHHVPFLPRPYGVRISVKPKM